MAISRNQLEKIWNASGGSKGGEKQNNASNNNYNTTNIETNINMPDYSENFDNIANSIDHVAEAIMKVADALETRNEIEYVKGIMKTYQDSKKDFPQVYKEIYQGGVNSAVSEYFGTGVSKESDMNELVKNIIRKYAHYERVNVFSVCDLWNTQGDLEVNIKDLENEILFYPYKTGNTNYDISVIALRKGREKKILQAFDNFINFTDPMRYITFVIKGEFNDHIVADLYYLPSDNNMFGKAGDYNQCYIITGVVTHKLQIMELHKALLEASTGAGCSDWFTKGYPLHMNKTNPHEALY